MCVMPRAAVHIFYHNFHVYDVKYLAHVLKKLNIYIQMISHQSQHET